jgi:hypothetical protein
MVNEPKAREALVSSGSGELLPPDVADLVGKANELLGEGQTTKALNLLSRSKIKSPWVTNALGVCQLRQGNSKVAVDVFRSLVLASGGLIIRNDVPTIFRTNYATALLADGNLAGCIAVLAEIRDEHNPGVKRLREAIRRWEQGLGFWRRLNWLLGSQPDEPVTLAPPLGDVA